jgi:hypothetical protein
MFHVMSRVTYLVTYLVTFHAHQIVMSQAKLMCGVRTLVPRRAPFLIARLVQLSVPMIREVVDVHAFAWVIRLVEPAVTTQLAHRLVPYRMFVVTTHRVRVERVALAEFRLAPTTPKVDQ